MKKTKEKYDTEMWHILFRAKYPPIYHYETAIQEESSISITFSFHAHCAQMQKVSSKYDCFLKSNVKLIF